MTPAATDLNYHGSGCRPDGTGGATPTFDIPSLNDGVLRASIEKRLSEKTMPRGALGRIESLALQIAMVQGSPAPVLERAALLVFAADHGVSRHGVSAFPREVTWQMVKNFLAGGAAINVFARGNDIALAIIDAGVDFVFDNGTELVDAKLAAGTGDFTLGPAMSRELCLLAVQTGARLTREQIELERADVVGFGEMGIGNTSSAALLCALMLRAPIADCIGRGTGLDDAGLAHKRRVLEQALVLHGHAVEPVDVLSRVGGLEIAMIVGGMLEAARLRRVIVIDGFIVTSALLIARALAPALPSYCVYAHRSAEHGHALALSSLQAEPLLDLNLRLGEGSGAALAIPLLRSAALMLTEMASFSSARVSQ